MSKLLSVFFVSLVVFLSGCSKPGLELTEEQYGDKWPLTVPSGHVECKNDSVIFHTNGKTYGVNGLAKSRGYPSIDEIWKVDPAFFEMVEEVAKIEKISVDEALKSMGSPSKISIGPILDSGLKLCK